jgi:uncharacterized protein (TIGR00255 family)
MKIRSMTAFAGAEQEIASCRFVWEVRSVNHRYLDLSLRLPETFRFLESDLRGRIGASIKRGRLDVTLSLKPSGQTEGDLRLNLGLVGQVLGAVREIETLAETPLPQATALDLLRWPGVLQESELDRESVAPQLLALLDQALGRLIEVRETEGAQLAELIRVRCQALREHVAKVRERTPAVIAAIKQKLAARLQELSAEPDQNRLEQEMVYLTQKMDIAEELDRLDGHIREVLRALEQQEPSGRRLDFLLQEMNREANTLGSKSADQETTLTTVDMKVLIEQMREQIQNIE